MKRKKGFTLVETLAVLAIIGILIVGTTVGVNTLWQNNRVDICESELRDFSTSIKSYISDYKAITIAPDSNYSEVLSETAEILSSKYLSCDIKIKNIAEDKRSAVLQTKIKEDPWGNKYEFDIYTYEGEDADSMPGLIVISSCGKDAKSNRQEYKNGNYGDDVVAVIKPN